VWILATIAYYGSGEDPRIGEPVDKFTAVEFAGFILTIIGNFVYVRLWERCSREEATTLPSLSSKTLLNGSPDGSERLPYA
jgi:hypothetical protein